MLNHNLKAVGLETMSLEPLISKIVNKIPRPVIFHLKSYLILDI